MSALSCAIPFTRSLTADELIPRRSQRRMSESTPVSSDRPAWKKSLRMKRSLEPSSIAWYRDLSCHLSRSARTPGGLFTAWGSSSRAGVSQ